MATTGGAKYAPLLAYLEAQETPQVTVAITVIRDQLGIVLPASAYAGTWWRRISPADPSLWQRAGWRVVDYDRDQRTVTFARRTAPPPA